MSMGVGVTTAPVDRVLHGKALWGYSTIVSVAWDHLQAQLFPSRT